MLSILLGPIRSRPAKEGGGGRGGEQEGCQGEGWYPCIIYTNIGAPPHVLDLNDFPFQISQDKGIGKEASGSPYLALHGGDLGKKAGGSPGRQLVQSIWPINNN